MPIVMVVDLESVVTRPESRSFPEPVLMDCAFMTDCFHRRKSEFWRVSCHEDLIFGVSGQYGEVRAEETFTTTLALSCSSLSRYGLLDLI